MMVPRIKVMSFKASGKFYTVSEHDLIPEHRLIHGYRLMDLIVDNDPSTRHYSDLSSGFSSPFYYCIDVSYPDEVSDFCTFLLDKTHE